MAELNEEDSLAESILLESNRKNRLIEIAKDYGRRRDLILTVVLGLMIFVFAGFQIQIGNHDLGALSIVGIFIISIILGNRINHLHKRVDALCKLLDDAETRNDNKDGDQDLVP